MTDIFSFVSVMVSLILGIGVAHLIQRVAEIIRARETVPLDWLQLTWALSLFLLAALYWWAFWDMRDANWTFPKYFFVLLFPTFLHFAISLLVATDRTGDPTAAPFDFARIRLPFMLIMTTCMVIALLDAWLVGTESAWTPYRPAQILLIGLNLAGVALRRPAAQRAIAIAVLLTFVIYGFVFRLLPGAFTS